MTRGVRDGEAVLHEAFLHEHADRSSQFSGQSGTRTIGQHSVHVHLEGEWRSPRGALIYSEGKALNMGGRTSKGACASRHSEAASGARRHHSGGVAKLRAAGGLGQRCDRPTIIHNQISIILGLLLANNILSSAAAAVCALPGTRAIA